MSTIISNTIDGNKNTTTVDVVNSQIDVLHQSPLGNQVYTLNGKSGPYNKPVEQNVASAFYDESLIGLSYTQIKGTLQGIADRTLISSALNDQNKIVNDSLSSGNSNGTYIENATAVYDYSRDLENSIINPGTYDSLGPISGQLANISARATVDYAEGGITVNERNRVLDGKIVDPYKNVNNSSEVIGQYDTIGGSDLTVFLIMEYVPPDQLALDPQLQQKEIMMIEMDSVLSISYSTIRERFPVRQMGVPNPVAITSGVRTIAGHIAFAVFTEDVLGRLRSRVKDGIASVQDQFGKFKPSAGRSEEDFKNKKKVWDRQRLTYDSFLNDSSANTVTLLDSLPPFNLLIMGVNEAGTFSQFMIKGVSIVDENQYQGTQQPNIINKVSFVATDLIPMQKIMNASQRVAIHSANSIDESYSKGQYNGKINFNTEITGSSLMDSIFNDLDKG